MYRLFTYVFLGLIITSSAQAASPWEGRWEMGRYDPAVGGVLIINNCNTSVCSFEIVSVHGAHVCQAEGTFAIDGNKAEYYQKIRENGENLDEQILFELNPDKRIIEVERISGGFCGMRAYIDGIYEHESLPYRYKTSFDCWAENLTLTEKAICSSPSLSKADLEFAANFNDIKTPDWLNKRNLCKDNQTCLKDFYKNSILKAFSDIKHKKFSLFNYAQSQKQKWYYPTDLLILNEFFLEAMPQEYYDAWVVSLNDDSYTLDCTNCIAYSYGVAGMYKSYESIIYIDQDQVWLAYVSANLKEPEDKNIIIFAPAGKNLDDMPAQIKDFADYLVNSGYYTQDSLKLKHFQNRSTSWIDKLRAWFK